MESGLRGKDERVICEHRRKEDLGHGGWTIGWFGKGQEGRQRQNVDVLDRTWQEEESREKRVM